MGFSILPRNRLCSIIISWLILPTLLASCSIIISWFWLGFRGLCPYFFGILFHHHFLVPARVPELFYSFGVLFHHHCHFLVLARVPGLVPLLFWHSFPSSFSGSGFGSGPCFPTFLESCSIIISWFWLGFRGLCPYFFGILFHHHFLVPARVPELFYSFGVLFHHHCHFLVLARVPGLVPLLFWHSFPPSFSGSGFGSGPCFPTFLESCSIIMPWFWLGFRGLSPYFFGILFHHPFLVPPFVPGLVPLLFWHSVPSSFPGSC